MILEIAATKYDELMEEISLFNEMGISNGQKLTGKLNSIRNTLATLKEIVVKGSFSSAEEEITFFKLWKPLFLARHYYETEVFKLLSHRPSTDETELKTYFLSELSFLDQFNNKHQFFHQYFITESTELDHFYFLRNTNPPNPIWTGPQDHDREFGSAGDTLFARFHCNSWLKAFILNSITEIGHPTLSPMVFDLTWTGEKQNLVELAYGIWLTRQLNNGSATLQQIISWLENSLQVDLGNVQKAFANIRARKRLSPTKYIDEIKEEVLKKIDDDLA